MNSGQPRVDDLQPRVLVVAAQEHDLRRGRLARTRAPTSTTPAESGPAVDVVAEEHHRVVGRELWQTREQRLQGREITVDVADREGTTRHDRILV